MRTSSFTTTCLSLAAASSTFTTGNADVTTAYYNSRSDYGYQLAEMPDFDQRRLGLLSGSGGDPGSSHCVPTSCTNLLGYMASHGYPALGPAFADWEDQDDYEEITAFVALLGFEMGTSSSGTAGDDAYSAMIARVVAPSDFKFVVGHEYRTNSNVVTLRELAVSGIRHDAIQTVCYGKYETIGELGASTVVKRIGGHSMTFNGAERSGPSRRLWAMDPDDGGAFGTQSRFGADDWETTWVGDLRVANSMIAAPLKRKQGMNRIMRGDSLFRFIDRRLAIMPVGVTTWGEWDGASTSISGSTWAMRENAFRHVDQGRVPFRPAGLLQIPFGDTLVIERLENGLARIWRAAGPDGTWEPMAFGDADGPDFLDFAISKDLGIIGIGVDGQLHEFPGDLGAEITPDTTRILLGGLQGYDRLSVDPGTGDIAVFNTGEGLLRLADRYLEDVRTHDIGFIGTISDQHPRIFSDFDGDGMNELLVQGHDGNQGRSITMIRFDAGQAVVQDVTGDLLGSCGPDCELGSFTVDESGALLLNLDGTIRSFVYDPNAQQGGRFMPAAEIGKASLFEGLLVGKGFDVSRSFTNFDRRVHESEGWTRTIEENECDDEECTVPGDINGDGRVDGEDLAILLGAWGTPDDSADLDGDGNVDGPDLAILLGQFGG